MAHSIYKNLKGLRPTYKSTVVVWTEHMDVHVEHEEGPKHFEMNIRLELKSDVCNTKTA